MAVKFLDAQGNVTTDLSKAVTRQLRNPGLSIDTNLPGEGELFLVGGTNDPLNQLQLGVRQGGGFTALSAAPGAGQADVGGLAAKLGLDLSKIGRFTTDILGAPGTNLGLVRSGDTSDFEFFRGFAPTQVKAGLTRTEDPAAIAASLDPSSQQNVQARAGAAQRFGEAGTFQTAGFNTSAPADTGTNPFFGIEAEFSGQLQSAEEAQAFKAATASGLTSQEAVSQITGARTGGTPEVDPGSPEGGGDNLATLTSPDGTQKTVVRVGSAEASRLLASGFTLGTSETATFIDSSALEDVSEIDTSVIDTDTQPSTPIQSAIETAKEQTKIITDAINDITSERDTTRDELGDLIEQLGGQEELLQEKLEEEGVRELERNLKNVRNEIQIKTAALEQRLAEIESTPQTLARQSGARAAANRAAQADLMFLQAKASAFMGDISFARETAQLAVNAKYNPILEEISIKQQQLKLIEAGADEELSTFISQLKLALDQQNAEVKLVKQQESDIQDIMLDAIDDGITDNAILNQIRNAGSVVEAARIAQLSSPVAPTGGGGGGGGGTTPSEEFTQAQLFDPFIQDLADKVQAGTKSISSMSKTDARKVTEIIRLREGARAAFPEADVFQDPVANFRFTDDAFVGLSDEERAEIEEFIQVRRSQGASDGEIFIELGGEL